MARQLFYGKLSDASPIGNGSNSYIRVTFDATTSSTTLTNVTDVGGVYLGLDFVRVGQMLVQSSSFPTGVTITAVDTVANTITVASLPATNITQGLARISPAEGDYYIASSSIFDPQGLINFNNITGSLDSDYDSTLSPEYAVLGQAANGSNTSINGRFHKYEIQEVYYRNVAATEGSIYISWDEKGTEASSGDQLFTGTNQTVAVVALSDNESLAPMFKSNFSGFTDLNTGQEFAAYQIEVQDFLDDLIQTDIYYTGSLVSKNNGGINFTGSGVNVTVSGSDGVFVNITGGGGDPFPYTGSAIISGSLEVIGSFDLLGSSIFSGSIFIDNPITGSSDNNIFLVTTNIANGDPNKFRINEEGVVVFGSFATSPTVVTGGMYFSSGSFYLYE
jgi:hypothetical protein